MVTVDCSLARSVKLVSLGERIVPCLSAEFDSLSPGFFCFIVKLQCLIELTLCSITSCSCCRELNITLLGPVSLSSIDNVLVVFLACCEDLVSLCVCSILVILDVSAVETKVAVGSAYF